MRYARQLHEGQANKHGVLCANRVRLRFMLPCCYSNIAHDAFKKRDTYRGEVVFSNGSAII